jgi:hypothetical protein
MNKLKNLPKFIDSLITSDILLSASSSKEISAE